jgi:hypothetical protein
MNKGERFIFLETNQEIKFISFDGSEYLFEFIYPNSKNNYLFFHGYNPLSEGLIEKKK